MRKRNLTGNSKTLLSKQLSSIVEKALRSKDASGAWKRPMAVKALAGQLGVGYQSLAYYLSARNNIPAFILPDICKALDNFAPLNALESRAGRVAYRLPSLSGESVGRDNVKAIQKLIKKVALALEGLSNTLEDNLVEECEFEHTQLQLHDVIRECVRLESLLELLRDGVEPDAAPAPPPHPIPLP